MKHSGGPWCVWLAPICHPSILSCNEGEENLKLLKGKSSPASNLPLRLSA